MKIELIYTHGCPSETLLRELMSYDIQLPECSLLHHPDNAPLNFSVSEISFTSLHWSRQFEYPWALLKADIQPNDVCLDAGGSYAVLKYAMAKRCKKVVAIDINKEHLDISKASAAKLGIKNIEYQHCGIENFHYPDGFDKVFCISVLEHIPDKNLRLFCLNNLIRMVKPGGQLLLTFDIILEKGESTYDFHMDKNDMSDILKSLGISNFFLDQPHYTANFAGGCVIETICVRIFDL